MFQQPDARDSAAPGLARSLSPSRVGAYLACPRQYRYRYIDRLPSVGPPAEPLQLGTLLHGAAAAYLSERPTTDAEVLDTLERLLTSRADEPVDRPAPLRAQLAALVLELHRCRADAVLADAACQTEVSLRARLGPLNIYTRADVVWRRDGEIVHDEYKLSSPEPALVQIATACARLGLRAIPNVGHLPIRHRLVVFRPEFSVRELAFDEPVFRLALRRLWDVATRLGAERAWAPNPRPEACGSCNYAAVCDAAAQCVAEAPF
jgi:putative RecB family exonuclease